MEELIPRLYKNYADYRNQRQMLPNAIDGCLPVRRRLLLSVHSIARKRFVKSAAILGHCMQHWHPHAEPYGALTVLVQDGFVEGQGQWGGRIGVEELNAADKRYTEVKAKPFIEDIIFKYIDHVPWEADELDPEPVVLPTIVPICLFAGARPYPPAFGFKATIPTYKLSDLLKRLRYLLGTQKGRKVIIKPYIEGCDIVSSNAECEKLLTSSTASIEVKGRIEKDPDNFMINILGWSYENKFQSIYTAIDKTKLMSSGDVIKRDESGEDGTRICFEVSRSRNRPEIYKRMEAAIDNAVTSTAHYHIYAVSPKDKSIVQPSVDQMLLNTYKFYTNVVKAYYTKQILDTEKDIDELMVIEKIRPHIEKVVSMKDVDKVIKKLSKLTKIDEEKIAFVISKHRIKKLLTVDTDISDLQKCIKEYKGILKNLSKFVLSEYKRIEEVCSEEGF